MDLADFHERSDLFLKIEKLKAEREKARAKAAEWQARVRELDKQITEQENLEILQVVRSVAVSPEDLRDLLAALRAAPQGATTIQDQEVNEHEI